MSIEEELQDHFSNEVDLPASGLGPAAIMRVGEERKKRNRFQSTITGFAVAAVAVLAVLMIPGQNTDGTLPDIAAPAAPESANDATLDDGATSERGFIEEAADSFFGGPGEPTRVAVEARTVDIDGFTFSIGESDLGWAWPIMADSTGFYALSTAPGTTWDDANEANGWQVEQAVYYSEDGLSWSSNSLPADAGGQVAFAAANGTMYLVGTSAATADEAPEAWIATSTDRGATWETTTMAIGAAEPPEGLGDYVYPQPITSITASGDTALAIIGMQYHIDVWGLAPREYRQGEYDIQQTADGLVVYDYADVYDAERACEDAWYHYELDTPEDERDPNYEPDLCKDLQDMWSNRSVIYEATWDELDVPDLGELGSTELVVMAAGQDPIVIPSPFEDSLDYVELGSTGDGFFATGYGPVDRAIEPWGSTTWTSSDGMTWSEVPEFAGSYEARPLGSWNGQLLFQTWDDSGPQLYLQGDSERIAINTDDVFGSSGSDAYLGSSGAGEMGLWLAIQGWDEDGYGESSMELAFTSDLENWSVFDVSELIGQGEFVELWVETMLVGADTVYFTVNGYNMEDDTTLRATVVGSR